jgi:hypothetical protein
MGEKDKKTLISELFENTIADPSLKDSKTQEEKELDNIFGDTELDNIMNQIMRAAKKMDEEISPTGPNREHETETIDEILAAMKAAEEVQQAPVHSSINDEDLKKDIKSILKKEYSPQKPPKNLNFNTDVEVADLETEIADKRETLGIKGFYKISLRPEDDISLANITMQQKQRFNEIKNIILDNKVATNRIHNVLTELIETKTEKKDRDSYLKEYCQILDIDNAKQDIFYSVAQVYDGVISGDKDFDHYLTEDKNLKLTPLVFFALSNEYKQLNKQTIDDLTLIRLSKKADKKGDYKDLDDFHFGARKPSNSPSLESQTYLVLPGAPDSLSAAKSESNVLIASEERRSFDRGESLAASASAPASISRSSSFDYFGMEEDSLASEMRKVKDKRMKPSEPTKLKRQDALDDFALSDPLAASPAPSREYGSINSRSRLCSTGSSIIDGLKSRNSEYGTVSIKPPNTPKIQLRAKQSGHIRG